MTDAKFLKPLAAAILGLTVFFQPARAAPTYEYGAISDISSDASGLYFRFSSGALPGNCVGAIGNWYRIASVNQAMISVVLSFYMAGKRNADVYSSGLTTDNYCNVAAFDPAE